MNITESIKYNKEYPLYLKYRFNDILSVKNVINNRQNKIKIRLFDQFVNYKKIVIGFNRIYFLVNEKEINKIELIDKETFKKFGTNKFISLYLNRLETINIVGSYVYEDVLTLCTYPTIETLKKSIQVNPIITNLKLQSCYSLTKHEATQIMDYVVEHA